jgi:lipoate-protein ligase A
MKYIDLTLGTPAENLACDEALLGLCEEGLEGEILRFWEPKETFVVVGYANRATREANLEACRAGNVPVLRRCSGGGTVLQGPGCLNYSLTLQIGGDQQLSEASQALSSITSTNRFILERHQAALKPLLKTAVAIQGHTDLATGGLKFSGNAQRRQRRCLIFHGTFLLGFDIAQVGKFLRMPSKQPDYRRNRSHAEFLTNLNLSPAEVKAALRNIWSANEVFANVPTDKIHEMVRDKYLTEAWNLKF